MWAARQLLEADDHDPIEIAAAGRSLRISNPAETDGVIWSKPVSSAGEDMGGGGEAVLIENNT